MVTLLVGLITAIIVASIYIEREGEVKRREDAAELARLKVAASKEANKVEV